MPSFVAAGRWCPALCAVKDSSRYLEHLLAAAICHVWAGGDLAGKVAAAYSARARGAIVISLGIMITVSLSACSAAQPHEAPLSPIAFVQGVDKIDLLYSNGETRFVTNGQGVAWAPGRQMLLVQRVKYINPPSSEVWLVSLDGRLIRRLTSVYPDQVRFFAAGQDRSRPLMIYATSKRGLQICDISTARQRSIPFNAIVDNLAVSYDGSRVAFATENTKGSIPSTLYVINIRDHGPPQAILPASPYRMPSSVAWSPNGQWIAVTLTINKGFPNFVTAVWLVRPDGTDLHMLTIGSAPEWSPDGAWISYIGGSANRIALFKVHPDGAGRIRLTPYANPSSLSSIGSQPSW